MSCGDNPEANMVPKKDPNYYRPDAGQSDPAGPDMRALMGESALVMYSALTSRYYDADRMTNRRGTSSTPTVPAAAILPDSVAPSAAVHFPVITAAASPQTGALSSAATPAAVASTLMFQAILSGDSRTLWPPEPTKVPPPPSPVLDKMKRALHAVDFGRRNWSCGRDVARRDSRSGQFSAPTQLGTRPGRRAAATPVTAVHADIGVRVAAPPRTESSIPVPMATNSLTRQLAFNAMSPQQVG
eukprot:6172321-Pleurochrysis_carterae.AAC.1